MLIVENQSNAFRNPIANGQGLHNIYMYFPVRDKSQFTYNSKPSIYM